MNPEQVDDEAGATRWDIPELTGAVSLAGKSPQCGLLIDGSVKCSGAQALDVRLPPRERFVELASAPPFVACARTDQGAIWCWGDEKWIGAGHSADCDSPGLCWRRPSEVQVPAADQIAAGGERVCARDRLGAIYCWGTWGHVKNTTDAMLSPELVNGLPRAKLLGGGHGHGCIVAEDDSVWCWGPLRFDKKWGTEGNPSIVPSRIEGLPRLKELAGGLHFMCGAAEDGSVWCWGRNAYGQLGAGDTKEHAEPVRVLPPGSLSP